MPKTNVAVVALPSGLTLALSVAVVVVTAVAAGVVATGRCRVAIRGGEAEDRAAGRAAELVATTRK